MRNKIITFSAILSICVVPVFPADAQDDRAIFIGGASPAGVYHAVGGAICKQVNKGRRRHGVYCFVESTNGSIDNLRAVRNGELEFGVAQSDWQRRAYYGMGLFASYGPFRNLRSVFSVHSESFVLLARKGASIQSFADLKGKRVNMGVSGSATRATMEVLMDAFGLAVGDLALVSDYRGTKISRALCDGTLDAAVYFVGHPNENVDLATSSCGAVLVEISGAPVERLVGGGYYRRAFIPGGMYPGNDKDIETIGADATVVTNADTPDDIVRAVMRAVFANIKSFRKLHPAFVALKADEMADTGQGAPPHPAAVQYFEEAGLR